MDEVAVNITPKSSAEEAPKQHVDDISPVASYLGISTPTNKETEKLTEIHQYLQRVSKTKLPGEILNALRHLEGKLGTPRIGENSLDNLYRYIQLRKQSHELDDELERLERGR